MRLTRRHMDIDRADVYRKRNYLKNSNAAAYYIDDTRSVDNYELNSQSVVEFQIPYPYVWNRHLLLLALFSAQPAVFFVLVLVLPLTLLHVTDLHFVVCFWVFGIFAF